MSDQAAGTYVLPATLVSRADLARLAREVESVDNELEAQRVRSSDQAGQYRLPNMSRSLADFLEGNKIDITNDQVRMALKEQLRVLKDHAPVIHMTFATEAEPDFLQQLTEWVRKEIHPQALISTGLQPALVGGAYVRTPNHVHDFSVRQLLGGKRDIITHELEGLTSAG